LDGDGLPAAAVLGQFLAFALGRSRCRDHAVPPCDGQLPTMIAHLICSILVQLSGRSFVVDGRSLTRYRAVPALRTPGHRTGRRNVVMDTSTHRTASPERWQRALLRALAAELVAKQDATTGLWIVASSSKPGVCYSTDGIACGCEAWAAGDAVCQHRAAF